jgi:sugar O-acyltransferase (sialic acid O-acetyltransferase NeuD family)
MKNYRLFLYGAGGHAKVIADMIENLHLPLFGAFDKNLLTNELLEKYPVFLSLQSTEVLESDQFVIAVGNNSYRKRIVLEDLKGRNFATIKDISATVSRYAEVEEGTVIMPGATINVDVHIGRHCIVNTNASIDHECIIEDFVHISPNVSLAGNVLVGEGTHIGIGATVIQGINIGKWCTIGAGSVIIRDIPDGATVVGNPGKIIKTV